MKKILLALSLTAVLAATPAPAGAAFSRPVRDDAPADERVLGEYENTVTADAPFRQARPGILIVGAGREVRALETYGGSTAAALAYADAANRYKAVFGDEVNVYCMVIPSAVEFYCPDKARRLTRPERPVISLMYGRLVPEVRAVNVYDALGGHAAEPVYSRTDHHWAPLGAYYAARRLAEVAGVPFKDLDEYEARTVRGYVGSMYGFSKDASLKNAPEDFVYYVPRDVEYATTYIDYTLDKARKNIVRESAPRQGPFFLDYKDGSGGAYCTFMGGDAKIAQVRTSTKNDRRVLLLKDSYGNAIPGFLFGSFEEIHVIDCRYFNKNIVEYARAHRITDIVFGNNIVHASASRTAKSYLRYLEQ